MIAAYFIYLPGFDMRKFPHEYSPLSTLTLIAPLVSYLETN